MQQDLNYGKRLRDAARKDFKAFWSGHRLWASVITLVSSASGIIIQVRFFKVGGMVNIGQTILSGLSGLVLSLLGTYLISMRRGAEVLDKDLNEQVHLGRSVIANLEQQVQAATEKPKRSTADEHRFQTAKASLVKHGIDGIEMLRHLRLHKQMLFGSYNPPMPTGMTGQRGAELLNLLAVDQLVTRSQIGSPGGFQTAYEIPPGLAGILDDLIY